MSERSSIFAVPPATSDITDFKPKTKVVDRPSPDEIDRVSAGGRFQSREASTLSNADGKNTERLPLPEQKVVEVDAQLTKRLPMVYRTGRNVVFSAKTTKEMVARFYALASANSWKAGETFERAVEALEREASVTDLV